MFNPELKTKCAWNKKLDQALRDLGFFCGPERADTLIVYVDDIIVASSSLVCMTNIKRELAQRFDIRDLGDLKYFIGLHIEKQPDGGYFVHQRKHCEDILEYFGMSDCNPEDPACDQALYRTGVGALLYLLNTRPDLAFPVGVLSRFLSDPSSSHHWSRIDLQRFRSHELGRLGRRRLVR